MKKRLIERIPFARIVIILACIFCLSLGLCGVTWILARNTGDSDQGTLALGFLEIAGILLSAVGLVIVLLFWAVLALLPGKSTQEDGSSSWVERVPPSDEPPDKE